MTTSPLDRAEAALAVQRRATKIYQDANRQLLTNLRMLGREDVARSIEDDVTKQLRLAGQREETPDDDDLAA